ncbi:MAG: SdrD B-like domain-containing protein [Planctomycetota bacterium]
MLWQRMIQRLTRRNRRRTTAVKRRGLRSLQHEALAKRELLASDLAAISGIAFADFNEDGLVDVGEERLAGVTVDLFRDVDASGTVTVGDGAAIQTQVTDANGMYFFRGLDQDTFLVVQQSAGSDLTAPDPVAITITDDGGQVLAPIDDFSTTGQSITLTGPASSSDSAVATEAVGGARDIEVVVNNTGTLTVVANATQDDLTIGSSGSGTGTVIVQYDGTDGTTTLSPTGLGGISLAGGNPGDTVDPDAGILIEADAQNAGETVTIRVFTDAANFAEETVNIPTIASGDTDVFVRYSSFTLTGAPDFNDVGALEFEVSTAPNNDITFRAFTVRGPNVNLQNLPNDQLLSLGGTVFTDLGGAANTNNGTLDAGETGVAGVVVELYDEPGGGGAIDPIGQTAVATTTTDANGDYLFTGLTAGNYLVLIPDAEFAAAEPLFGNVTSTGNDPATDPDDDIDGDDNGTLVAGAGISSGEITLVAGGETGADGDADASINLSVDFGVTPTIDLAITKTLDTANSTLTPGGEAFFDIAFQNNGPLDATNVVLTDVIPTGMTIDQANSNFGAFTPTITGQNVSVAIGTLNATATGSIRIAVDIATNQTADLTNTAEIEGDQVETDDSNNSDDAIIAIERTDLSITKSDNTTGSVVAGEQFTYTLTVTNAGPNTATGIVVTDALPSDLSFVSGTFTTGSGTVTENPAASGNLTINVDDLAATGTAVIDVVVLVSETSGDTLVNTATVASTPDLDTDTSNNSATETTPVVRNVDMTVTKTTTGTATAGTTQTYSLAVTNNGPGTARGVTVVDTLDSRLTFNTLNAGATGVTVSQNGQELTFDVGDVAANATVLFSFTVDIATSATGVINNAATVSTTDTDTDATNDTGSVNITAIVDTDLILDKSVDLATATPGDSTLTYTFTISHDTDSVSDSGQVTFTDTLPAGLTGLTIDAPTALSSGFDTTQQTVTVDFASIPIGETRTFTVTASVNEDATGTIDNTGSITVAGGESDTTNNSDTASTTLNPAFDVTLTKTPDDTTPAPSSNVTYTIALTNAGPSTATNVVLTDDVPTGMTFVSGTLEGQAATLNGSTVTFPAITLDDDETVNATLIFTVGADASGTITNTASVTADAGETDTTNNTATADVTATPQADLTVAKLVDQTSVQSGDTLNYTVTVTNNGVSTAVDPTATDTLPSGVTFVSGTGPNNEALTATNGVVTVTGDDLAPGGSFQFTIVATVDSNASGTLTNNVSVSTTTAESDTTNNAASAATEVDPFQSSISGFVYLDPDNDGDFADDEVGLSGFVITLTGTDSNGDAITERSVVTGDDGSYQFLQLPAGTYQVTQTQLEDFVDGQTTVGSNATAQAADNVFTDLDLDFSTNATDFNFGELSAILSKRRFLASS